MNSNLQQLQQPSWTDQEKKSISILEEFVGTMVEENLASNPQMIIQEIWKWSNPQQSDCIKMICDLIIKSNDFINKDEEQQKLEQLVNKLLDNWQKSENSESQYLKDIENKIITNNRSAFILRSYKQIIRANTLDVKQKTPEQEALLNWGLVTFKNNRLEISNLIYKKAFSIEWVEETFSNKRPYKYQEKLKKWQEANQEDNDYFLGFEHLIVGDELENALEWIAGLELQEAEHKYLIRSQIRNLGRAN